MQNNIKIEQVDISKLKSAGYNPRKWNDEEKANLEKSIKKFGLIDPIIVNSAPKRKNIIIGGHFRLSVVKNMGIKKVPVVYISIPDKEKEKELNIRLNKNVGDWDIDLLIGNFDKVMLGDIGFNMGNLKSNFDSFDEEDEALQKSIAEVQGNFITVVIEFMKKDYDVFIEAMKKTKVKLRTSVKKSSYGAKIVEIIKKSNI